MYQSSSGVKVTTLVLAENDIDVRYNVCDDGVVELSIGGTDVLEMTVDERGLATLAEVLPRALRELRSNC